MSTEKKVKHIVNILDIDKFDMGISAEIINPVTNTSIKVRIFGGAADKPSSMVANRRISFFKDGEAYDIGKDIRKLKDNFYYTRYYKATFDFVGVAVRNIPTLVFGKLYSSVPEDVIHMCKTYTNYRNGQKNTSKWKLIIRNQEVIRQSLKDGLKNISPIVALLGEDPQVLKKKLGKSSWKMLCRNSFSVNRQIVRSVDILRNGYDYGGRDIEELIVEIGKMYNDIISKNGVSKGMFIGKELVSHATQYCTEVNVRHGELLRTIFSDTNSRTIHNQSGRIMIFSDTIRLITQLGEHLRILNRVENYADLREIHDNLMVRFNTERVRRHVPQNSNFDISNSIFVKSVNSEFNNYQADLILTDESLREEGRKMSHCVGSYCYRVARGEYLVYHISSGKGKDATLGIRKVGGKWNFDQVYHYRNKEVACEELKGLCSKVLVLLNEGERSGR